MNYDAARHCAIDIGGTFANGAVTGAFGYLFNEAMHRSRGRGLTGGERSLGESVYQDSIDYDGVRIIEGKYHPFQPGDTYITPDGNIYAPSGIYSSDYSAESLTVRGDFIHEMAHVLQYQEGVNVRWEGLKLFMSGGYSSGNIARTYGVTYQANYLNVNIEQQAQLWRMFYLTRQGAGP